MQDRTSANSMKVLLQRTAGPYIQVIHDRGSQGQRPKHVRLAPKADKQADVSLSPLCAKTGRGQPQQNLRSLDRVESSSQRGNRLADVAMHPPVKPVAQSRDQGLLQFSALRLIAFASRRVRQFRPTNHEKIMQCVQ
jgi:hypothetical protein